MPTKCEQCWFNTDDLLPVSYGICRKFYMHTLSYMYSNRHCKEVGMNEFPLRHDTNNEDM